MITDETRQQRHERLFTAALNGLLANGHNLGSTALIRRAKEIADAACELYDRDAAANPHSFTKEGGSGG